MIDTNKLSHGDNLSTILQKKYNHSILSVNYFNKIRDINNYLNKNFVITTTHQFYFFHPCINFC